MVDPLATVTTPAFVLPLVEPLAVWFHPARSYGVVWGLQFVLLVLGIAGASGDDSYPVTTVFFMLLFCSIFVLPIVLTAITPTFPSAGKVPPSRIRTVLPVVAGVFVLAFLASAYIESPGTSGTVLVLAVGTAAGFDPGSALGATGTVPLVVLVPVTLAPLALLAALGAAIVWQSGVEPPWRGGWDPDALADRAVAGTVGRYRRIRARVGDDAVPAGGTARASGTVRPVGELVRTPVDGDPAVVCAYRIDGYDDATDAKYASGVGEDAPWPDLVSGVDAVPFRLDPGDGDEEGNGNGDGGPGDDGPTDGESGDDPPADADPGGVVVDPVPWDPGVEVEPERFGRPHGDYRTSSIGFPAVEERVVDLEDLPGEFGDRVRAALADRTGGDPPDELHLRVEQRSLDPGVDAVVVGWSVGDRDHVDADIVNVADPGVPFRIETVA